MRWCVHPHSEHSVSALVINVVICTGKEEGWLCFLDRALVKPKGQRHQAQ